VSYENLFISYINNTVEEANSFNLQRFLQEYYLTCENEYELTKNTLLEYLGTEIYLIINDLSKGFKYWIDYNLNSIVIQKIEPICTLSHDNK
jgi:hypothetical protein